MNLETKSSRDLGCPDGSNSMRTPEGSLIKAPTSAAIDVAFFILMVGGFLGVVNETGTLDVGIASIVRNTKAVKKC